LSDVSKAILEHAVAILGRVLERRGVDEELREVTILPPS
jgi:hypothetical protein